MNEMRFEFSDTIAGYVTSYNKDQKTFTMKTTDGREFSGRMTPTAYAKGPRNLHEGWCDYTGKVDALMVPGQIEACRKVRGGSQAVLICKSFA